jgi:hypothetical protein
MKTYDEYANFSSNPRTNKTRWRQVNCSRHSVGQRNRWPRKSIRIKITHASKSVECDRFFLNPRRFAEFKYHRNATKGPCLTQSGHGKAWRLGVANDAILNPKNVIFFAYSK